MGASCDAVGAVVELLAEVVTELTQTETTAKTKRTVRKYSIVQYIRANRGTVVANEKTCFKVRANANSTLIRISILKYIQKSKSSLQKKNKCRCYPYQLPNQIR